MPLESKPHVRTDGGGDAKSEVGQRTDDEDGHDDDEDQRHVLAVSRPTTGRGQTEHGLTTVNFYSPAERDTTHEKAKR